MDIREIMKDAHETAVKNGWWNQPVINGVQQEKNCGEFIALCHTELSEAYEEYRNGKELGEIYYSGGGKPEGFVVELADEIIRICDHCEHKNLPLLRAIVEKLEYNKRRPYRHGGKLA